MIKKLLLIMMFTTIIVSSKYQETKAIGEDPSVSYTSTNLYSTYYALEGIIDYVPVYLHSLVINVPDTIYSVDQIGGYSGSLTLYNSGGVSQESITFGTDCIKGSGTYDPDSFNCQTTGRLEFDFSESGLNWTIDSGYYLKLLLPQNYGSTPSGYTTFMEDNTTLEYYYSQPTYRQHYFTGNYVSGYRFIESFNNPMPSNVETITLDFREYGNVFATDGIGTTSNESYIKLYDDTDTLLDTLFIYQYEDVDNDFITIAIPYDPIEYELNDIATYDLGIIITNDFTFSELNNANSNISIEFNRNIFKINYYSSANLYSSQRVYANEIPTAPTDPSAPPNYLFGGWYDETGYFYNHTVFVPRDKTENNVYSLYAYFYLDDEAVDYNTTDPTPDTNDILTVINGIGFGSDTGRTIIYVIVAVGLAVALIFIKLPPSIILLAELLVTSIFLFLGLLPLLVSTIVMTGLIIGLIRTIKGGK